mgnify:CR=1 FL=1
MVAALGEVTVSVGARVVGDELGEEEILTGEDEGGVVGGTVAAAVDT